MEFSTISLFKVNLIPSKAGSENKLGPAELDEIKKLIAIEKVDCRFESAEKAIEREGEFVQKYDTDLKPRREERLENDKERMKRKSAVESQILIEEEERQKALAAKRDAEFAQKLKQEELDRLAEQKKKQEMEQEKDNKAFTLMSQFNTLDWSAARALLE